MTDNSYFFRYMRDLLGDRYGDFERAYAEKPRHKALRVNTSKTGVGEFLSLFGGDLAVNPLCYNSFYTDVKPSLDPLYHAGLYYMQEPSASAAVAVFSPYIGKRVLDLCAAPGGKCTQAAEYMRGGMIFCNDPEYKRVSALAENIERLGIRNAVITCNRVADYRAAGFDGYFDTLIVDAPCSGGGMMRYESVPFTPEIVSGCAARQREILKDAVHLLRRGGYMLYSTCTFTKEENEDSVEYLISLGMETVDIPLLCGEERGIGIANARRVYPMNFDGEGAFFCVLFKPFGEQNDRPPMRKKRINAKINGLSLPAADIHGRTMIDLDCEVPLLDGLNVVRLGAAVYDKREGISHALTHALSVGDVDRVGAVELDARSADEYLRGGELSADAPRGELIATYRGYALGAAKCAPSGSGGPVLKNKYPKNLRIR